MDDTAKAEFASLMAAELEAMDAEVTHDAPPAEEPAYDATCAPSDSTGPDINGIELLLARENLPPKARTTLKSLRAALHQTGTLKKSALEKGARSTP
ncbi:MAG: hypothetical protein MRY72_03285 [Aquisalinus sp.]|nr:hypothetical protein [Aquisalinus sp.]